jgi:outer membrane cobalamin receptor
VPEHQAVLRAEYVEPRLLSVSVQGRYHGDRYQDDLNTGRIDDSFLLDLSLSRRVTRRLELYAVVENALDTQFMVANTGDPEFGHPRLVHGGVRFRWEGAPASGR